MAAGKSAFGNIRRLPSGRYQARYTGPDGREHKAPVTFDAKADASAWLALQRSEIVRKTWRPEQSKSARLTFGTYASTWLAGRDLKPRTRAEYRALLDRLILPTFARTALAEIDPASVRAWHASLDRGTPTQRAHAYALLRTVLSTAVDDELLAANPCRIRGAGTTKRQVRIRPASLEELETIAASVPERYKLLVLLAAWCALRFGECTELRRPDVDLKAGVLRIRRGVVRTADGFIVGTPKSTAGIRDVAIPPHLIPLVREHLLAHAAPGRDGLLFPAAGDPTAHLAPATLYRVYYPARAAAGRPDLRFHDLRHTGAVLAAATGATLAELMARLGHSTPGAAMRYQHASSTRDHAIAEALSRLATGSGQ